MVKNDAYIYEMTINSTLETVRADSRTQENDVRTIRMIQQVSEVNADGSYTIEVLVMPQGLTKSKEEIPLESTQQRVVMKMSRSGKILESNLETQTTMPSFPTRPIHLGETWEDELMLNIPSPVDGLPRNLRLVSVRTLRDIERTMGFDCAHIAVMNPEMELSLGGGNYQRITARGDTYFAHKDGRLVKSDTESRVMTAFSDLVLLNRITIGLSLVTQSEEPSAAACHV